MKYATYEAFNGDKKIASLHSSNELAQKAAKKKGENFGVATVSDDARIGGFLRNFEI